MVALRVLGATTNYERCLNSKDLKGKHVTATLQQHGRKTLESEYLKFMAAYEMASKSRDLRQPRSHASGSGVNVAMQAEVSADELARYRRCLDRLLDQIKTRQSQDEKLVPRIRQLGRSRQIPRKIEPLMLTVAEIRNASEHDRNQPSRDERLAAKHAWDAIVQWASNQGLQIPDG